MQWSNVLEMVYESRIDSVGLNERVNSLATRSIKKDSKLEALNMIVTMCDLTTLEGEDTEGKISQMVAKAIKPNPLDTSVPRVVRSHIVTIIFSASNFESFFILLVASEFTLSFNPTESIRDSYTISKTLDHCIETSEVFIFPIILC